MDFHCTHCQSTELQKVSLVYQQSCFHVKARTRFRGFVLDAVGPDLIAGYAHTAGVLQTRLSRKLRPPIQRSYLKLLSWFALFSFLALVAYVQSVMSNSGRPSLLPVAIYIVVAPCLFVFLALLVWRHNRRAYPAQYARWDRSFLCMCCGKVSAQTK
jgi:hypothetical protein